MTVIIIIAMDMVLDPEESCTSSGGQRHKSRMMLITVGVMVTCLGMCMVTGMAMVQVEAVVMVMVMAIAMSWSRSFM